MARSTPFRRFTRWLQYRMNLLLTRGATVQYAMLAAVAVLVVLLGINAWFFGLFSRDALEAEGIDNRLGGGFVDSLWWSLKHVIDPGAFAEDYGAPLPVLVISFLLSVTGLALLGLFIAFITSSVQRQLRLARKGSAEVVEHDHTLILGWSKKVSSILAFLGAASSRRTVVILAPRDIGEMQDALRLGQSAWRHLSVVLRSGPTSSLDELERVGLGRAASVIAVADEVGKDRGRESDIETIKTLMLLSRYDRWSGAGPHLVAEITQKRNVEIAAIAGARSVPLVSSSEIISKVMVQATRQPGISSVYAEIFSYGGNTAFVEPCPAAEGRAFGEIAHWFPEAVPIGVSWRGEDGKRLHAALNPEPDYEVAGDERLILLARGPRSAFDPDRRPPPRVADGDGSKLARPLERLLILGWNENIDEILGELDAHSTGNAEVTILAAHDQDFAMDFLRVTMAREFRRISVDYRRGGAVNRRTLEALEPESYDAIITLADESHGESDPDARTIMTMLVLGDVLQGGRAPHIVAEIHDGANEDLVRGTVAGDVVVSPEMVSLQLAQISRNPVLGSIYRELLSAGGIEIGLQAAGRYAPPGRPTSFDELAAAAQRFTEIAIGVCQGGRIVLNPAKDSSWTLGAEDRLVVLAQQLYE
jgi:hypothetical protein